MTSYFSDDSMLRQVTREWIVAFGGPRALLMQAAHPVAFVGFFAHTGSLADPYARLRRTAEVMDTIAWGPREEADRATRRVRAMHAKVRGRTTQAAGRFPAGTPYAADDPELLLWILATLADSVVLVYERYVRRLGDGEREALWEDYRVVGRLFGLGDEEMPEDWGAFDAYMNRMLASGDLLVTDRARELAVDIVMHPPLPPAARPLLELVNQTTVGLLPPAIRRQYGFRWDPLREAALRGGAEYAKRVLVPLAPEKLRLVPQARRLAVAG
ncbi:MAG: DUF2236 domain-containing protein [Solirubrobacterales bacterium]|nr:DUF2236 domain-containing protein [Solirubrobacterales bacterium]